MDNKVIRPGTGLTGQDLGAPLSGAASRLGKTLEQLFAARLSADWLLSLVNASRMEAPPLELLVGDMAKTVS